jgi:hypothetical protein
MTQSLSRRAFLSRVAAGGAAAAMVSPADSAEPILTPEMFGARGDGVTNDSAAFRLLAEAVNKAGGGTVALRRTTYIVGRQRPALKPDALYYFAPDDLLFFARCTRPVVVRGNGARLLCERGLRYGVFDSAGNPRKTAMPYLGPGVASPYLFMVQAERCSGGIEISDLELDGNLPGLSIGGQYGDTGWQIPANGIGLVNNSGPEIVRNVYSHHHPLDGLSIDGLDSAAPRLPQRLVHGLRSEYNGRQGVSIVGGRGYAFEACKFNHTGRSTISSAPGAGVDIEAEGGKKNRDFSFTDCEFVDNSGCGLVADTGDSEGARFTRCTFIGTTMWSAWPYKPRFRFFSCRFVGALVRAWGDDDPERAAQFTDCTFRDDPALSPTGKVYLATPKGGPIADLSSSKNVLFRRCTFALTGKGLLPWSWFAIYEDCRMSQRSLAEGYPKGKYRGTTILDGKVDLYGSTVEGVLIGNGKRIEKVQMGGNSW